MYTILKYSIHYNLEVKIKHIVLINFILSVAIL